MSPEDYKMLFLCQVNSFAEAVGGVLEDCELLMNKREKILRINTPPTNLDNISRFHDLVLRQAYLKLGCTGIKVYCCGEILIDYNLREDDIKSDMTLALSKETETNTGWVSFKSIAEALSLPVAFVEEEVERFEISVQRRQGQWGLSTSNLADYLDLHYDLVKEAIQKSLSNRDSSCSTVSETKEKIEIPPVVVEQLNQEVEAEHVNGNGTIASVPPINKPISMTLPKKFNLIEGDRQRRPSPKRGLQLALGALPKGKKGQDNYYAYLENIVLNTSEGIAFVQQLSEHYRTPKSAIEEIKKAASELWDENYKEQAG